MEKITKKMNKSDMIAQYPHDNRRVLTNIVNDIFTWTTIIGHSTLEFE